MVIILPFAPAPNQEASNGRDGFVDTALIRGNAKQLTETSVELN
jgi:hypothetical protein